MSRHAWASLPTTVWQAGTERPGSQERQKGKVWLHRALVPWALPTLDASNVLQRCVSSPARPAGGATGADGRGGQPVAPPAPALPLPAGGGGVSVVTCAMRDGDAQGAESAPVAGCDAVERGPSPDMKLCQQAAPPVSSGQQRADCTPRPSHAGPPQPGLPGCRRAHHKGADGAPQPTHKRVEHKDACGGRSGTLLFVTLSQEVGK